MTPPAKKKQDPRRTVLSWTRAGGGRDTAAQSDSDGAGTERVFRWMWRKMARQKGSRRRFSVRFSLSQKERERNLSPFASLTHQAASGWQDCQQLFNEIKCSQVCISKHQHTLQWRSLGADLYQNSILMTLSKLLNNLYRQLSQFIWIF